MKEGRPDRAGRQRPSLSPSRFRPMTTGETERGRQKIIARIVELRGRGPRIPRQKKGRWPWQQENGGNKWQLLGRRKNPKAIPSSHE